MSINSWKKEFYKGRVKEAGRTAASALNHSALKWNGLTQANLRRHGLFYHYVYGVTNPDTESQLAVDVDTCALCVYDELQSTLSGNGRRGCSHCPLTQLNKSFKCSNSHSPFSYWADTGNPARMIKAIAQCKELLHIR